MVRGAKLLDHVCPAIFCQLKKITLLAAKLRHLADLIIQQRNQTFDTILKVKI